MLASLFNKVAVRHKNGSKTSNISFPVNITNFLRTAFSIEHLWCLLLVWGYWEIPWNGIFLDLSLYNYLNILEKTSFHPWWKFCKIVWHLLEILTRSKTKNHGILHEFLVNSPGNSISFLIDPWWYFYMPGLSSISWKFHVQSSTIPLLVFFLEEPNFKLRYFS